jgi:alanine racemase
VTRYRPTVAEIDLGAIAHNVRLLRPPGAELMAVVKADGYGHGDAEVARAALGAGASRLGVSLVEEGLGLRDRGIDAPILVLTEFPPGSEKEALERGLTPTVYTDEGVAGVAEAARALGRPAGVHLKLDTGMHRVGLWPPDDAPAFAVRVLDAGLGLEGLWTHFADSELDDTGTLEQLARFRVAADALVAVGITPGVLHAANSGATIRFPQTHLDLVRPGAAVYGVDPGGGLAEPFGLRPALSWRSAVTMVKRLPSGSRLSYGGRYALEREATIATVPVGYDDGFPRQLGGNSEVLIGGRRHQVVGTVTMDQILVDCGDDSVSWGDEVVLIGTQGDERITIEEIAERAGTIPRQIATGIGGRVPREYPAANGQPR